MKQICTAMLLVASTIVCCSESQGQGLLNRMMSRGGCGTCASSCCDTPADACAPANDCCRRSLFNFNFNCGMAGGGCGLMGGGGLFARFGSNCCDTPAEPCAEADPCQDSCGCRLLSGGLLSGLFNRNCGCAAPCETAEPSEQPAADCCDPCCRSGRLRNLMSRIRNINLFNRGNGCCETEQADPCASDCCGGGFNLMGRVRGMVAGMVGNRGCGCEAAPACEADPCGCASRTGLLDRLRGRLASRGCCDPCCGNGSDAAGEETPQPDSDNKVEGSAANLAPIVDPSAFSIRGGIVETLN